MDDALGAVVRRRRLELGLSQTKLARRAGIAQAYLSRIESGERKALQIDLRRRLAEALEMPAAWLGVAASDAPPAPIAIVDASFFEEIVRLAQVAREGGNSREAERIAGMVVRSLPLDDATPVRAALRARAMLAQAVARGDLLPASGLRPVVAGLRRAYALAAPSDADTAHDIALKLGNELRKAGEPKEGLAWCRRAVDDAPDEGARQRARIALIRNLVVLQRADEVLPEVRRLRSVEDRPDLWTPTLQPFVIAEVEVRAGVALGRRPLIGRSSGLDAPPRGVLAPQWRAIAELTRAEALMQRRKDDEALAAIAAGHDLARELALKQQTARAVRLLRQSRAPAAADLRDRARESTMTERHMPGRHKQEANGS